MNDITDAVLDAVLQSASGDLSEMDRQYLDLLIENGSVEDATTPKTTGNFLSSMQDATPDRGEAGVLRMARKLGHGAAVDAWRYAHGLEEVLRYAWENKGAAGTSKSGLELFKWVDTDGKQRPRVQHSEPGKGRTKKDPTASPDANRDGSAQPKPKKTKQAKQAKPDVQAMTQEISSLDREAITPEHVANYTEQLNRLTVPELTQMREALKLDAGSLKRPKKNDAVKRILDHIEGKEQAKSPTESAKEAVGKFRETGEGDLHEIAKAVMQMKPAEIRALGAELQAEKGGRSKQEMTDRVLAGLLGEQLRKSLSPKTQTDATAKAEEEPAVEDANEPAVGTGGDAGAAGPSFLNKLWQKFRDAVIEKEEPAGEPAGEPTEEPAKEPTEEAEPAAEEPAAVEPTPEPEPEPRKPLPAAEQTVVPGGIEKLNNFSRAKSLDRLYEHFGADNAKKLLKDGFIAKTGSWMNGYTYVPTGKAQSVLRGYNRASEKDQAAWREAENRAELDRELGGPPKLDTPEEPDTTSEGEGAGTEPQAETPPAPQRPATQDEQARQALLMDGPVNTFAKVMEHYGDAPAPQRAKKAVQMAVAASGFHNITPAIIDSAFGSDIWDSFKDEQLDKGNPYDVVSKRLTTRAANQLFGSDPVDLTGVESLPKGGRVKPEEKKKVQELFSRLHQQADVLRSMSYNFDDDAMAASLKGKPKPENYADNYRVYDQLKKHAQAISDGLQIAKNNGNEAAFMGQLAKQYNLTPQPQATFATKNKSGWFSQKQGSARRYAQRYARLSRQAMRDGDRASAVIYARQARQAQHYAWENRGQIGTNKSGQPEYQYVNTDTGEVREQHIEPGSRKPKTAGKPTAATKPQSTPKPEPETAEGYEWDGTVDRRYLTTTYAEFKESFNTYDSRGDEWTTNMSLQEADYDLDPDGDNPESVITLFRWVARNDVDNEISDVGEWTQNPQEAEAALIDYIRNNAEDPPDEEDEDEEEEDDEGLGYEVPQGVAFGKSKANLRIRDGDEEAVGRAMKFLFGSEDAHEELCSALGAPDGATVMVDSSGSKSIMVRIKHPKLARCSRFLGVDDDGKKFIKNEILEVKDAFQKSGFGTAIFSRQVENAASSGFAYIKTHAAGSKGDPNFNGYYTWPLLGYNESIKSIAEDDPDLARMMRRDFPDAKSVLDLMQTAEGQEWWSENGADLLEAKFDLRDGSRSRAVLASYQQARAAKGRAVSPTLLE